MVFLFINHRNMIELIDLKKIVTITKCHYTYLVVYSPILFLFPFFTEIENNNMYPKGDRVLLFFVKETLLKSLFCCLRRLYF